MSTVGIEAYARSSNGSEPINQIELFAREQGAQDPALSLSAPKTAEKVNNWVLTVTLFYGTTVQIPLKEKQITRLQPIYAKLNELQKDELDLQKDVAECSTGQERELILQAREILGESFSSSFNWANRPSNLRGGSARAELPYTQKETPALQKFKERCLLTVSQRIESWTNCLETHKQLLDKPRTDPVEETARKKDLKAIEEMLEKLKKVNRGAISFNIQNKSPDADTPHDQLKDTIEKRKEIAMRWIQQEYSTSGAVWQGVKTKVGFGQEQAMSELGFAYDLALQGIEDRALYLAACKAVDIPPKQDTLEFSLSQAINNNSLDTAPLSSFFKELSPVIRGQIETAFIPPVPPVSP